MKVLVQNCRRTSLKFCLIETDPERAKSDAEEILASGTVEKIGMAESLIRYSDAKGHQIEDKSIILELSLAVQKMLQYLTDPEHGIIADPSEIDAVGHRIVHGGETFSEAEEITPEVLNRIRDCIPLAPLHNPPGVMAYEVASLLLPNVPHVAVFDTAFHQTMPDYAYLYALPFSVYEHHQIRRYGFHGSSHASIPGRLERLTDTPRSDMNIISVHLGNGSSIAAIEGGKSVDTSMGMTPLEGLAMSTRSGDIDPAIVLFLMEKENLEPDQANNLLNKHSGLLGITDLSSDMREVLAKVEAGDDRARLALDVFCYRIRKYIGSYSAVLGRVDHIAFTGGIGENAALVRQKACQGLEGFGVEFDDERNQAANNQACPITKDGSRVQAWVIPTTQEIMIARDTMRCVLNEPREPVGAVGGDARA